MSRGPATDVLPTLFIGSSTEGADVAHAIQENLFGHAEASVWDQGVFQLSDYQLVELISRVQAADFAVLVCSADDVTNMRGKVLRNVRDNVLFELGMFVGKIGIERTFFLIPANAEDLHLPSDLSGITYGQYATNRRDRDWRQATAPFCTSVRRKIQDYSFRRKKAHDRLDALAVAYACCEWIPDVTPVGGVKRWEQKEQLYAKMVDICRSEPVNKSEISAETMSLLGNPVLDFLASKIRVFAAVEAKPELEDLETVLKVSLDSLPDGNARIRALYSARAISDNFDMPLQRLRKFKDWSMAVSTSENYVKDAQNLLYKSFERNISRQNLDSP